MSERTVLEEQHRLSDDLYGLMGLVAAERDPHALLERLLRQAVQALQLSGALAFGVQGGHWHLGAVLGTFGQLGPRQLGQVQSEVVSQVSTLEDGALLTLPLRPGWRAVPLRLDGELLGLLVLDEGQRSAEALPGRERFLHALALQGAAALGYARLAARLRHSEARYQRLMQESPTAIASGFLGGELTEVNDAYLELLGFTREEYERGELDWTALTPPEYRAADADAFQRAFDHGTSGHYEKEMLTKTGERLPLDLLLIQYAEGDRQRVVGYLQDLRRQRETEARWMTHTNGLQGQLDGQSLTVTEQAEQLAQQKAELEARTSVLEGFTALNSDLTLDTDPYALIKRAQQFTLSMLPAQAFAAYYEPEMGLWRLKAQVGDMGNPDLQAALDAGLPFEQTTNLLRPWRQGAPYYQDIYDTAADPVAQEAAQLRSTATLPVLVRGEPRGIFAIGLNVARAWTRIDRVILESVVRNLGLALERAEQTQTLQHRTLALERSNRELEQFAYIASHDLQEPLRTVTSFSELLVRQLGDPAGNPRAARYAAFITDATGRMHTLIQDLLTFSRVSIQPRALARTSLNTVLGQVRDDLRHQLQLTGGELVVGPLPAVLGDAAQLRQLFQNLIGNALKFRAPERAPQVRVTAQRAGQWVRLTVADNGIGIEPEYFEKIFTVFQRLHGREHYEGNGIGLAIVRKIVERHGGTVDLSSVMGQGTTFTLTLPVAPDSKDRINGAVL